MNIYAPNKDSWSIKFLNILRTTLHKENPDEEENVIQGRDLVINCPLNQLQDKKGYLYRGNRL